MKRVLIVSFIAAALAWSCEDRFGYGDFAESGIESNDSIILLAGEIGKKGIAVEQSGSDWSSRVSSTAAHWHFSGASKLSFNEPGNIDFVPMVADSAVLRQEGKDALLSMKENGSLRYLMGYDNPDSLNGANLSVAEAIALWPSLEEFDVPLASPLCADAEGPWMEDFMAEAATAGLKVDYVAMQWIEGKDPVAFLEKVESIYTKYGKKVWIVKFTPGEGARLGEVVNFMEKTLPKLETNDHVFRYAWLPSSEANTPTSFWDNTGALNSQGRYYADFSMNPFVSVGRDDWIDLDNIANLAVNPGFETGDLSGWGGYGTGIESTDVYSGSFAGRANITGWGSAFNYTIDVESGGNYYISFAAKLTEEITGPDGFEGVTAVVANGHDKNLKYFWFDPVSSTEWISMAEQVEVPDTITKLRVTFWRPKNTPELILDDLVIAKIE